MDSVFVRASLWLIGCGLAFALCAEGRALGADDEVVAPPSLMAPTADEATADAKSDAAEGKPVPDEKSTDDQPDEPPSGDDSAAAAPKSDETKTGPAEKGDAAKPGARLQAPPQSDVKLLDLLQKACESQPPAEAAEFHGVRPGVSTSDSVRAAWGGPTDSQRQKQIVRQAYRLKDYQRVEAHFRLDKVVTLIVYLDRPAPLADLSELAQELELDAGQAFGVKDEFGEILGASFPERGVALVFEAGSRDRRVLQAIIEPITAQPFLLRAEERMSGDYLGALRDLDAALKLEPNLARAHWLRGRLYRTLGQIEAATLEVGTAQRLDPRNAEYLLTSAALLAEQGEQQDALAATNEALALAEGKPELKALALNQLADQMATASQKNFKQALNLHLEAIKLADPLSRSRVAATRRMAQQAMLGAYLSSARAIAWGHFQQKSKIVPQWLTQAEAMAEKMAALEANSDQGLRVCREALAASVGVDGKLNPKRYADRALAIGQPTIAETDDPLRKQYLHWELGTALYDALQACHARGDKEHALEYGEQAVKHLESATAGRQLEPMEAYLLGRLYFRLGAVCATDAKTPDEALRWYERAMPLLERPVPQSAVADAGRHGEAFVSMAVSYWAAGSQEEALRLTRQGLKLMEKAVEDGRLENEALKAPYTNLATMHRHMGDDEQADAFEAMAAKATETKKR